MNQVFKPFLRKIVTIFFDDSLVYSHSLEDQFHHLEFIFQTIRENHIFLNQPKCNLALLIIEYLRHFISKKGVSTDPYKNQVVTSWQIPSNLKQLRGCLIKEER